MKTKFYAFLLIVMVFSINSCTKDDYTDFCEANHWSYHQANKPEFWGLCYGDCDANAQSPIDITGATADNSLNALNMTYEESPIKLINNGHAIEFEYEAGSTIEVNGTTYELKQFHFHGQSEHTINGKRYPLEMHLVHKSEAGDYAVVGVLFETGSESAFLANFADHLPAIKDEKYEAGDSLNAIDLIPANAGYYNYSGSLTTPPCSETVNWFVLKTPLQASAAQLQKFTDILKDNYRPIQDLNGRTIRSFN